MMDSLALNATAVPADGLGDVIREYMAVTERLAATHEVLQREVSRLRAELESKDRELERRQRLAALGELAAGVAHEVRNPLGAIQLYSGLLKAECGRSQAANSLLEKIESGIRAIDAVVQDTLALTPRAHQLAPQPVRSFVEAAVEACGRVLDARGVSLRIENGPSNAVVVVDEQAIQRVLINLITNAAEASSSGTTITVVVESEQDGSVSISVRDQGCGIPSDQLERIFDPFFTTKGTGTGLGLAIAHRLIEAHGGRLRARNRAEGGADFSIVLPGSGGFAQNVPIETAVANAAAA
jgi:signal transduction histidine kinase